MEHSRAVLALAIVLGLTFSAGASAGISIHATDCSGCTGAQLEALAPNCEQGSRLISDFAGGRLYEGCFDIRGVERRVATHAGAVAMSSKIYHWYQPTADKQNAFQAYLNVYNLNGHVRAAAAAVRVHVDIVPKSSLGDDGYMNAYDTIGSKANSDAVLNWLNTTNFSTARISAPPGIAPFSPAYSAAMAQLINTIKSSIVNFDYNVKITVVFHDGSTRDYTVNKTGDWETVPNSSRDGHGNETPENRDAVANNGGYANYSYAGVGPNYDLSNFLATMQALGVPVVGVDTGSKKLLCSWDGTTMRCLWQ